MRGNICDRDHGRRLIPLSRREAQERPMERLRLARAMTIKSIDGDISEIVT